MCRFGEMVVQVFHPLTPLPVVCLVPLLSSKSGRNLEMSYSGDYAIHKLHFFLLCRAFGARHCIPSSFQQLSMSSPPISPPLTPTRALAGTAGAAGRPHPAGHGAPLQEVHVRRGGR